MNQSLKLFTVTALASALAACGGSGSGSDATGTVSMDVTDAPTASFSEVVVTFTGITLKPAGGEAIEFTFDEAKTLDLLTLQGGESAPLLDGEEVLAGEYDWVRLTLDVDNSYVTDAEGRKTLFIPSGAQTGLKLGSGFNVAQGGENNFTIDFDVRKSIVNPQGGPADYFLKPALRLVDNLEVGSITGQVDYSAIQQTRGTGDTEDALADCAYEGSAYIYEGADVTPTDLNVNNDEGTPLMVVPVTPNEGDSFYSYTAAFLTAGDYTVSYSCQLDDNEEDNAIQFDGTQNVTVEAGVKTEAETIPLVQ